MSTEAADPQYVDIDAWPLAKAVEAMLAGQQAAIEAVRPSLPAIAAAADAAAARLGASGRLVYAGAGTSGRIAVQDGVELTPTFNWPASRLAFAMAGGLDALTQGIEGAEDDASAGAARMNELEIGCEDVVSGVAASGTTPFTVAAVVQARKRGALTLGIASNPGSPLLEAAEHPILLDTGPEIVAGSTRMKAGTAQKAALNLFSTALMMRLGRVYKGLMVDMLPLNAKLRERAIGIVGQIAGCGDLQAEQALEMAQWDIKLAVLIAGDVGRETAKERLRAAGGNLRKALEK